MNVLVIGGAGYIGSHCVRQLIEAGHNPVVLDNLVYGHKGALLPSVKFYCGNLDDPVLVGKILDDEKIDLILSQQCLRSRFFGGDNAESWSQKIRILLHLRDIRNPRKIAAGGRYAPASNKSLRADQT